MRRASLEAQIAGESLFNDGVGVVVFLGLASMAGLSGGLRRRGAGEKLVSPQRCSRFAKWWAASALGLALGYVGYRALKSIDDHPLELLITLALVMFLYALSFWIHVSGPIAVVVAGLLIGNPGRRFAMSDRTREHVDAFWSMIDEVLNAVLFLLLGLEVFAVQRWSDVLVPALLAVLICLVARAISVAVPVAAMAGARIATTRVDTDIDVERAARGHLGRAGAGAAAVSGEGHPAGEHLRRRGLLGAGPGAHRATRARVLRSRRARDAGVLKSRGPL